MDKGIETLRKDLIDLIDYSLDTARLYGYADADLNHSEDDYKRGYDDACFDYNRGLADGMEDAWECARKLCQSEKYGGLEEHCAEIFDRQDTFDVFDYSASEAIAKVKEYEQIDEMSMKEAIATLKYQYNNGQMEQDVHKALGMAIKSMEYIDDHAL